MHSRYTICAEPNVPDALVAYAAYLQGALGLTGWQITLRMEAPPDVIPEDGAITGGYADITEPSHIAGITIVDDGADLDELQRRLLHEFLHLLLAHLHESTAALHPLLPKNLHAFAESHTVDALERTVAHLTAVLFPVLPGTQ